MLEAGKKMGKLTLIERTPGNKAAKTNARWTARCDCGKTKSFVEGNIKSGMTRSCGCGHRRTKSNDIGAALACTNWES